MGRLPKCLVGSRTRCVKLNRRKSGSVRRNVIGPIARKNLRECNALRHVVSQLRHSDVGGCDLSGGNNLDIDIQAVAIDEPC